MKELKNRGIPYKIYLSEGMITDYLLAFGALGLSGLFCNKKVSSTLQPPSPHSWGN